MESINVIPQVTAHLSLIERIDIPQKNNVPPKPLPKESTVPIEVPSSSKVFKVLGHVGAVFDAVTGVSSVIHAFKNDTEMGDKTYTKTMEKILSTVAQNALSFVAASAVTAVAGTTLLPLIAAGAVAAGTGYLVGKILE